MNEQTIILILGILATLAGGIAKYIQSRGQADLEEMRIELERVKGANAKTSSDEKQTDRLIASQNDLVVTLARTIERFDKFFGRLDEVEETVKAVETNVDDWHLAIKTIIEQEAKHIVRQLVQQRETLEQSRHQEFLTFASEFASVFVAMQKAQRLDTGLFAVPSPQHPGWKYKYATPVHDRVAFYNAPWLDDETPMPEVEIDKEGELVHVIEDYVHGWHVIAKTKNGFDFPGIGYVAAWSVKLSEVKGDH